MRWRRTASDAELEPPPTHAFEFVRLRSSRLRTSLTRDVGTRKTLKLRGEPNRPPFPSELGPVWQDAEHTTITLSRKRSMRLGGWQLGRPVTVSQPSGPARREVGEHALGQRGMGDRGRP